MHCAGSCTLKSTSSASRAISAIAEVLVLCYKVGYKIVLIRRPWSELAKKAKFQRLSRSNLESINSLVERKRYILQIYYWEQPCRNSWCQFKKGGSGCRSFTQILWVIKFVLGNKFIASFYQNISSHALDGGWPISNLAELRMVCPVVTYEIQLFQNDFSLRRRTSEIICFSAW